MTNVAIIGVGNMGLGMARALLSSGFKVHGCDLAAPAAAAAQQAGVHLHATPARVAAQVDTVLIAVVNAAQIDGLLLDLLPALTPRHTVLFMSTIAPSDATRFVACVLATGARAIDAPMSGGPARAAAGQMTLMLAGSTTAIEAAKPVTDALANRCFVIGERAGDATKVKLLNNLLAGIHLVAGAQVLKLAGELGLNPQTFLDVTQVASGQSWIAGDRLPRALADDFEPRSYLHILSKDVVLANEMLAANGYALPLGSDAQAVFQAGLNAGHTQLDDCALFLLPAAKTVKKSI
jgi:3-hydroxyisobutyrate dehydrogenase